MIIYDELLKELIEKYNKSVEKTLFPCVKSYSDVILAKLRSRSEVNSIMQKHKSIWSINSSMQNKFGDGRYHYFVKVYPGGIISDYTHRCIEDFWFYHEKWFMDDISTPILLDEELFKI